MKKILSTILTLTILVSACVVQCSAQTIYIDSSGNCYSIEDNVDGVKKETETEPKTKNEEKRSIFSKISTFFLKALLVATVVIGSTAALCKWSKDGKWAKKVNEYIRAFYNNTVVPILNKISNIPLRGGNETLGQYVGKQLTKFVNTALPGNTTVGQLSHSVTDVLSKNFKTLFLGDVSQEK